MKDKLKELEQRITALEETIKADYSQAILEPIASFPAQPRYLFLQHRNMAMELLQREGRWYLGVKVKGQHSCFVPGTSGQQRHYIPLREL
ncbi:hypothetical protein MRX96_040190 [Rhipicephalus microplus]